MTAPAAGLRRVEDDPALERAIELVRGTRDWLPPDCARYGELERRLLESFAACRIRDDTHADPRIHRAARAQERRGYRLQALRARFGGPVGSLPPTRADGKHRPRLYPGARVPPPALAGQQLRARLSLRRRDRLEPAARVQPGRSRAAGRRRPCCRRRGDRSRRPVARSSFGSRCEPSGSAMSG